VTRGNHEQCTRAGQGWYRFLDTETYSEARSCNDPANDNLANYNNPYAVPIGPDGQGVVFDSSNTGAAAITATSNPTTFNNYQSEVRAAAALMNPSAAYNVWANHHPLFGFAPSAGAPPAGGNAALLSVMAATFPGTYFPPGFNVALHGHTHLFEAIDF